MSEDGSTQAATDRRTQVRHKPHPDDYVIVNKVRFPLRNWSPVGLLFGPMSNPPPIGERLELKVGVLSRGDRLRFDAIGEVMRVDHGNVAVRYTCSADNESRIKVHFDSLR